MQARNARPSEATETRMSRKHNLRVMLEVPYFHNLLSLSMLDYWLGLVGLCKMYPLLLLIP